MLLNEFLKEHKMVQELKSALREQEAIVAQLKDDGANYQATISDLRKAMETVVARLKKQDSKIQNVSDKVELNRMGPYTLASKP
jgi:peptidoglycan hydrolase CwlO-like protein